jgi:hypothetical protein
VARIIFSPVEWPCASILSKPLLATQAGIFGAKPVEAGGRHSEEQLVAYGAGPEVPAPNALLRYDIYGVAALHG